MTYDEYKNNKKGSNKKGILKSMISKIFTITIFVLVVLIISNVSPKFKNFIIDKVLNSTMNFSFINKITDNITNIFNTEETKLVVKELDNYSIYKDGYKYEHNGEVKVRSSGIVTFIGEKEGYGNTIVIQQSDGYYAWYGNIKESVKLYDYIERDASLGTCENNYYYVLLKDDKPVLNEN